VDVWEVLTILGPLEREGEMEANGVRKSSRIFLRRDLESQLPNLIGPSRLPADHMHVRDDEQTSSPRPRHSSGSKQNAHKT
jgi:hypothetical protein